jgi:hypothetical protein
MLRFAFTMAKTDAAKTIGTFGPFTFTATCAPGAGTNVHAQITAKTSTAHSYLKATTINADMATTDTVSVVDVDSSGANANDVQHPVAFDPTGTVSVDGGDGFGAYVNTAGGNDCRFFGHILNDAG